MTLALAGLATVAHAGFIDERKAADSPPPTPAAAAVSPQPAASAPVPAMPGGDEAAATKLIPAGENRPYQLVAGRPVHLQIMDWAKSSGWVLKWSPQNTWEVFADTTIVASSADAAVEQVIQTLRMEGKPIRLRVYAGNRVMEVEAMTIGE